MNRMQALVQKFHREVLKQSHSPAEPQLRNPKLRSRLSLEETFEKVIAFLGSSEGLRTIDEMRAEIVKRVEANPARYAEPNLIEAIDGICDSIVVNCGDAEDIGIDIEPFYEEVMRSNLAKAGGHIDEHGKQHKPPGWTPPDIEGVLAVLRERMTVNKVGECVRIHHTCKRGCCVERESNGIIDEIVFSSSGHQQGAWVKDSEGYRTYARFTDTKGVMET